MKKDPREETTLKIALEALIVDLRAALTEFGIAPEGNTLYPESELSDRGASHQHFFDPEHCDDGLKPDSKKITWVDANQSDYPIKVGKAYWNSAQLLKGLLEVKSTYSPVSAFAGQFKTTQEKMNACFDYMDDNRPEAGKDYRTQAPQVVDPKTFRLAKIYKKFVDVMVKDEDPLEAMRLSAANFSGGGLAASKINENKALFQKQFSLAQQALSERIGIYEARLNQNLHVEDGADRVIREEVIRSRLQKRLRKFEEYCDAVDQSVSQTRQFLEGLEYREIKPAAAKVEALEERLRQLENVVEFDLQQNLDELEQEKKSVDSLYSIRDPNYALVIFSGEPESDVVRPLDPQQKEALKKEYDDAEKTLQENHEKKRAELNELKTALRKELAVQKELQKKESMPLGPSVNLSHRAIEEETEESLREAQEVLKTIVDQTPLEYRTASFFVMGNKTRHVFGDLSDIKKSIRALNERLEVVRQHKSALNEVLSELKGASIPITDVLFSKIKSAMGWKDAEASQWEYLKQSQGVVGRLGVMIRYSTAPIDQINQAVAKELVEVEKEEEHLQGEIERYRVEQTQHQVEFSGLVRDAENAFVREFQTLMNELESGIQDPDLLESLQQSRKDTEVMSEQLFGKNEAHQQLFEEFDRRYQSLAKPAVSVEAKQELAEDTAPQKRTELYERYFGEKGLGSEYIEARSKAILYKFKDKLQAAVTKKSDVSERFEYLSEISKQLEVYGKTGDPEIIMILRGKIQQELRDEKKFPSRVTSMLKSKKSESEPDTKTLRGVLERLDRDLKNELSRRISEPQEGKENVDDSRSSKK